MQLQTNWYQELLQDLRELEFKGIILTKWSIGKRILEDFDKFGTPEYGSKRVENIAKDMKVASSDVFACVKFAERFSTIGRELEDKSWHYVRQNLLYESKEVKQIETPELPKGKYQIIYADPPWSYYKGGYKNQSQHYDGMSIEDICKLPIQEISADNCILFLWVTFPILPDAFKVIESWGFTYSTVGFTWVKSNKSGKGFFFGLGNWTRANTELCLIATKGKIKRKDASISQIINTPIQEHSKKPDIVRNKIVQLVGNLPRIELFARQKTKGWGIWGSETPK